MILLRNYFVHEQSVSIIHDETRASPHSQQDVRACHAFSIILIETGNIVCCMLYVASVFRCFRVDDNRNIIETVFIFACFRKIGRENFHDIPKIPCACFGGNSKFFKILRNVDHGFRVFHVDFVINYRKINDS